MYPGRFDPVTNGHLDIVRRAARIYEEVVVAVANSKSTLFTTEERVRFFEAAVAEMSNVRVVPVYGLTVDAAHAEGAHVLVKGMRAITDFNSEFDQALMNRKMAPEIESIYMISRLENLFIRGTSIREVAALGYDVSDFVPAHVAKALKLKFGRG